jgi:YcaO-like protein with predicted kinase domain
MNSLTLKASADYLNALSRDELFDRFEITRLAEITGLDIIGVPVFSAIRPASKTISVSAGKSRVREMARAGAIAEAIEFHTFENPTGDYVKARCEVPELPLSNCSRYRPEMRIPLQPVWHYGTGKCVLYPRELIWMGRHHNRFMFMGSSNGQGVGATFADAFLTGLYEVVERDQWMLRRISLLKLGVYPPRVEFPSSLGHIKRKCDEASLNLYLLYCTVDLGIPVYWALLIDDSSTGSYAGFGCHLSHRIAAEKAILEAIQSRCVYIAGARDDVETADYEGTKAINAAVVNQALQSLPVGQIGPSGLESLTTKEEIKEIIWRLGPWAEKIYFKDIDLGDMHAAKVMIPGLECPCLNNGSWWRSTGRWEKLRRSIM